MEIIKISEREFKKVKSQQGKVLIECYATWCGTCKMMNQIMNKASEEINSCKLYKIDLDEADEVMIEYNINSVPTTLLFENGKLLKKEVGLMTKDEIKKMINN